MKLFGQSLCAGAVCRDCRRLWPTPFLLLFLAAAIVPCRARASDLTGNGSASVISGDSYDYVYGRRAVGGDAVASGSLVNVSGGTVSMDLYGGSALSRNGFPGSTTTFTAATPEATWAEPRPTATA